MTWDQTAIETLRVHLRNGLSRGQIAVAMNLSRSAISSAVRVYIHGIRDLRSAWERNSHEAKSGSRIPQHPVRWSDDVLTEPWATFTARRKAERDGHHAGR